MRNSQVGDLLVASTVVDGTVLTRGVCLLVYEDEQSAIGLMLNRPLQMMPVAVDKAGTDDETAGDFGKSQSGSASKTNRVFKIQQEHDKSLGPEELVLHQTEQLGGDVVPLAKQIVALIGPKGDLEAGQLLAGKSLHFGGPLSGPIVAIHGAAELAEAEAGKGIFVAAQRDNLEALLQSKQPRPYRLIVGHLGWSQTQLNNEIEAGVWHRMPATAEILQTDDVSLWSKLVPSATSSSVSRWLDIPHIADAHLLN